MWLLVCPWCLMIQQRCLEHVAAAVSMWGLDALSCWHCLGWSRPKEVVEKSASGESGESGVSWLDAEESSSSWVSPFTVRLWRVRSAYLFGKDLIHGEWKIMEKILGCNLSEASCRLYISRCITIFWRFISRFISYGLIFTIYSNIVLYHVDIIDIHVFLIHPWGR